MSEIFDQIEEVSWDVLSPHNKRGALFIVDLSLDLKDVCRAVANDDAAQVKEWLSEGKLNRPTEDEVKTWDDNPKVFTMKFVIVQPFVLVQKIIS